MEYLAILAFVSFFFISFYFLFIVVVEFCIIRTLFSLINVQI